MRLIVRGPIYRAFPELDRYTGQQCEKFVAAACRSWGARLVRWPLLAAVGVVGCAVAAYGGQLAAEWLARGNLRGDMLYMLVFALSCGALGSVVLGLVLLLRDRLLRRRIGVVLRTRGVCVSCQYNLVGLPVGPGNLVRCPECEFETEVDPALGELAEGAVFAPHDPGRHAGAIPESFEPKEPAPAKKPVDRPRRRRISRLGWVSLAVLLVITGVVGVEVVWVALAPAGRAGQHVTEYEKLVSVYSEAPGPDGWAMLCAALAIKDRVEGAAGGVRVDYMELFNPPANAGDAQWKTSAETARKVAKQLETSGLSEQLEALCGTVRIVRDVPQGKAFEHLLPQLGSARGLCRLHLYWIREAAAAGDDARRAAILEQMLAVGRACASNFTLIDELVGIAMVDLICRAFREGLVEWPMDEASLVRAMGAIDRQVLPTMSVALEGERLSLLDAMDWTHSDDGNGNGRLRPRELGSIIPLMGSGLTGFDPSKLPTPAANVASLWYATKKQSIEKLNEFYRGQSKAAGVARSQRKGVFDEDRFIAGLSERYILLRAALPRLGRIGDGLDRANLELRGTKVMIAIELYRVRHGAYPSGLDALVPGILPAIPADPVSEKAWAYRVVDPGSDPHHRGYLLYTVGADGVDDGGRMPATEGEQAEVLVGKRQGFDYVLNQPEVRAEKK